MEQGNGDRSDVFLYVLGVGTNPVGLTELSAALGDSPA